MTDNRLLLQSDVIRIVDKHTNDKNVLDDDISCILENCPSFEYRIGRDDSKENNIEKEKRIQLFENDNIVLEQRGNRYYLSLFDQEGKFRREIAITVKDDYKVTMFNDK